MSMESFTGSAIHTIDPKGSVFVPINYRAALGNDFCIALNNDLRTIALYPKEIWREKCDSYGRIPDADRVGRHFVRYILGNTFTDCNLDGQGRILIPQTLRMMYDLNESKDIRFIGVGEYLELWNAEKYHGLIMTPDPDADKILDYVYDTYFRVSPKENGMQNGGL